MKKLGLTLVAVAALGLGACDTIAASGTKQKIGAVSGAAIGGILGSKVGGGSGQLWATGAGAILGGLAGSEIGSSLDRADMLYASDATFKAQSAPLGEAVSWNNPESGNSGTVVPVRDGKDSSGNYCREYQQTIYVGGKQETGFGTACQQADGTWKIVS